MDAFFFYILIAAIFVIDMAYLEFKRLVITGVVSMPIYRIWIIFNRENIEIVKEGADKQKAAADRMMHVSEDIVTYFDEANVMSKN